MKKVYVKDNNLRQVFSIIYPTSEFLDDPFAPIIYKSGKFIKKGNSSISLERKKELSSNV